jgi:ribosomal protein S18 acetylase RimI-like enzyme
MLVRSPNVTPAVVAMLVRAMSEGARDEAISDYCKGRGPTLFGWSVDGSLVCVAGLSVDGSLGEIVHIATDPAFERQGHAEALLNAVVDDLGLAVLVTDTDQEAVDFYRRVGFGVESIESPWPTARFRCTLRRG